MQLAPDYLISYFIVVMSLGKRYIFQQNPTQCSVNKTDICESHSLFPGEEVPRCTAKQMDMLLTATGY